MAVVYALVVGMLVYRRISVRGLSVTLHRSAISTAAIMFIIANAGVFGFLLNRAGVPDALGHWLAEIFTNRASFLLGVNAALFLIGMFIETSAAIVGAGPFAAARWRWALALIRCHFGVVMVINLALGMITPPFGVNLFAAGSIAKLSLEHLIRPLLPFVAVVLACLMVITYVPDISLWLRDVVYR